RIRQKSPVYQMPADWAETIAILRENDMFVIGLSLAEVEGGTEKLSQHLYRVQKISLGDYNFRHHLISTTQNNDGLVRIASFKKWSELHPIKVKISCTGQISGLV